jgi:predicted transcriptional regulator
MVNRGRFSIIKDILIEAAPKGEKDEDVLNGSLKTYIMGEVGLSYKQLKNYLEDLIKKNLLKEESRWFITTQKGLEYLEHYHKLQQLAK